MPPKPSLKDIAARLGVSIALVSYVLNDKKQGRISKEMAQKIRDTAAEMNYRTNQIARSLKTRKTQTIGLILSNIANPFSSHLAGIIETAAEQEGYIVFMGSSEERPEKFKKLIEGLLDRQVDGLILAPAANSETELVLLQQQLIPFVLVDRYFPELPTNYVALDNYEASRKAVEHLVENGCRKISMIAFESGFHHLNERIRGYREGLRQNKILFKKKWLKTITLPGSKTEIEKSVRSLLDTNDPVDAILFGNNSIAHHAVNLINTMQVRVPQDLALVSFDEPETLELFHAPLTYIKQPLEEMGQQAMRILLEAVEKNNKITQVNMDAELVVRKSSQRKIER